MAIQNQHFQFMDIHYHASPDLYLRRYGVMAAGKLYKQFNGAVVLKSHLGSTAVHATIAQQEGLPVFPSLVMNKLSGGIHYQSILRALAQYQPLIPSKLIVHLPTITGRKHKSLLKRDAAHPGFHEELTVPETIFDDKGHLKAALKDIFKVARDYPIVLSTGHASKEEVYALVDACDKERVGALLLNQPANPLTGLSANELLEVTKAPFVWVEQTALTYLLTHQNEQDFESVLKFVPRVIYSSDLGQTTQIDLPEWLECTNKWFTHFQLSNTRRAQLCLHNPIKLLQI